MSFDKRTYFKERKELVEYLAQREWHLAATFTFKYIMTEGQAQIALKHFWNHVDERLYGKSARRVGNKCGRACFLEKGSSGQHLHYHATVAIPDDKNMDAGRFQAFLEAHWHSLKEAGRIEFKPIDNQDGWLSYITKEVVKYGTDAFDPHNTHIAG